VRSAVQRRPRLLPSSAQLPVPQGLAGLLGNTEAGIRPTTNTSPSMALSLPARLPVGRGGIVSEADRQHIPIWSMSRLIKVRNPASVAVQRERREAGRFLDAERSILRNLAYPPLVPDRSPVGICRRCLLGTPVPRTERPPGREAVAPPKACGRCQGRRPSGRHRVSCPRL
jgi:hypothetical protein